MVDVVVVEVHRHLTRRSPSPSRQKSRSSWRRSVAVTW
jgi:hypothetical protein